MNGDADEVGMIGQRFIDLYSAWGQAKRQNSSKTSLSS